MRTLRLHAITMIAVAKKKVRTMEEFNIDIELDEAAQIRIDYADFLTKIKDWGMRYGRIGSSFNQLAELLIESSAEEVRVDIIKVAIPLIAGEFATLVNELYDTIQYKAVEILGAPFQLHEKHSEHCENGGACGHQDHYINKTDGE